MDEDEGQSSLRHEIESLERRLAEAKARLAETNLRHKEAAAASAANASPPPPEKLIESDGPLSTTPHHYLLLLSDSALPLGSFAFSAGLESTLAHLHAQPAAPGTPKPTPGQRFATFLPLSLESHAAATLPFLLHTHRHPASLAAAADRLAAATICAVARRASTAQGRALLSIWERSLAPALGPTTTARATEPIAALTAFSASLRPGPPSTDASPDATPAEAHLAPLFGAIAHVLGLSLHQAAYSFVLAHVKGLLSAAVRASVFGPYQAQRILAGEAVQEGVRCAVRNVWRWDVDDAGQAVPVMDLWVGRHELLYSRIFNS